MEKVYKGAADTWALVVMKHRKTEDANLWNAVGEYFQ
jgi:hypothetical protein